MSNSATSFSSDPIFRMTLIFRFGPTVSESRRQPLVAVLNSGTWDAKRMTALCFGVFRCTTLRIWSSSRSEQNSRTSRSSGRNGASDTSSRVSDAVVYTNQFGIKAKHIRT